MKYIFFSCVFLCLLNSCSNPEYKLKRMIGSSFEFPEDKMFQWNPDTMLMRYSYNTAKYKLIVYADSSECSQCYLTHLEHWNKYVTIEQDSKGKLLCVFIIEGKKEEIPIVASMTNLKHPLFFDEDFSLRHTNPQIPQENMFHVFLVDSEDKIKFVGNPLRNEKIEEILDSIIKKDVIA